MKTLVFFLEEPSAKEMLLGFLPNILPENVIPRFIVFNGKQDLEKHLLNKLRGWCVPNTNFIVIEDQDCSDCLEVKAKLSKICHDSGQKNTLVRIACRELETFYLGDLKAVEKGLNIKNLSIKYGTSARYRVPDTIVNPSKALYELTNKKYQKMSGSRAIGPHLSIQNNCSTSFNALINGILKIINSD